MPRDSSGNYTFPAGVPFVSGTAISATTMNSVLSDLAAEVEDSLSRSGEGGMLTSFTLSDGTVSAPGAAFTSDSDTGMYRNSTGPELNFSVSGTERLSLTTAGADVTGTLATTGALTVAAGGATVTAGGMTVTAGGLTVAAGGAAITGDVSVTGTLTASVAPVVIGCLQCDLGGVVANIGNVVRITSSSWATNRLTVNFTALPTNTYAPLVTYGGSLFSTVAVLMITSQTTGYIYIDKYDMAGSAANWASGDRVTIVIFQP